MWHYPFEPGNPYSRYQVQLELDDFLPTERHAACSPITVARSIRCAAMLMHRDKDEVVPLAQSRAMTEANSAILLRVIPERGMDSHLCRIFGKRRAMMRVTDRTREALRCRRIRRKLVADGFEEIGQNGGHLWELHRDIERDHNTITAVAIAPEGMTLFVKAERKI